jgi:hypothetical protein
LPRTAGGPLKVRDWLNHAGSYPPSRPSNAVPVWPRCGLGFVYYWGNTAARALQLDSPLDDARALDGRSRLRVGRPAAARTRAGAIRWRLRAEDPTSRVDHSKPKIRRVELRKREEERAPAAARPEPASR